MGVSVRDCMSPDFLNTARLSVATLPGPTVPVKTVGVSIPPQQTPSLYSRGPAPPLRNELFGVSPVVGMEYVRSSSNTKPRA